jgi:DNA-binding NarL/FixJ family response regulator
MKTRKKLLIVEDEDMLRQAYVDIFTNEKYTVIDAQNGKVALEKLVNFEPDVIILDILMPVMGGIEFLQKVDPAKKYPNTRILVLSNLSDKETIHDVLKLGATKHALKSSLSPKELVSAIKSL